ncbi:MAG: hypothetical protein QNJ30_11550 [Kiloniellales bacterium]|nr:hypothetical protein [Kiloniellales bacterium]
MSDVFFPPPRFTTSAAPKASSGVHATITHPPPATAALATGSIVRGTVIGTDAKGQILVKTESGVLPLQTKAQLAQGSQVTLQVRIAGTELHVVILNVEAGKNAPRHQGGQGGPQEAPQGRVPATTAAPAAPATLSDEDVASGRLIRAVLEPAAAQGRTPANSAGSGPAAALPAGGEVLVRLISVTAPSAGPGATTAGPAAPSGAAAALIAQETSQSSTGGPGAPAVAMGAQGQPLRLEGLVAAAPGSQGATIETAQGNLRLAVQTALPPGTRLVLELTPAAGPQTAAEAPEASVRDSGLARGWPALEEALRILQPGDLQPAGMTLGSHALPRPGPRFASTLLFFLAALRGGDLGAWLSGATAQALERAGRGDLVARLKQDFARMSRLAAEPAPGEWRGYLVPVFDGGALSQVRLFVRGPETDEREEDGPAAPGRATRFVVEVAFSRLGELQLDGLIQGRRFDLILRSRAPLPEPLRRDIAEIYEAAGAATGYSGQLVFQASADWAPLPLDAMTAGAEAGVVV